MQLQEIIAIQARVKTLPDFISPPILKKALGFSNWTLEQAMKEGLLPRPEKYGPRTRRWPKTELLAWLSALQVNRGRLS